MTTKPPLPSPPPREAEWGGNLASGSSIARDVPSDVHTWGSSAAGSPGMEAEYLGWAGPGFWELGRGLQVGSNPSECRLLLDCGTL